MKTSGGESISYLKTVIVNVYLQIPHGVSGIAQGGIFIHHAISKCFILQPNVALLSFHTKSNPKGVKQTDP